MDYHSSKRTEANNYALEKIKSTISSKSNLLKIPFTRIEPIARSGQVFFSNKDEVNKPQQQVFGNGIRLSDEDREKTRKRILERLSSNFEKYNSGDTSVDVRRENIISDEDAQITFGDMLLDSLMVRTYNNDVGFDFFNDVLKFKNFIVVNIWKFKNIDTFDNYIEKLTVFNRQLEASSSEDETKALAKNRFKLIIEKMGSSGSISDNYTIAKLEDEFNDIRNGYSDVISKNLSSSIVVIEKLIKYIKENRNAIGDTERNRKQISKALLTSLQLNKVDMTKVESKIRKSQQNVIDEEQKRIRDMGLIPPPVPPVPPVTPYVPPPPVPPPQPPILPPTPSAQQLINVVDPTYTKRSTELEIRGLTQPEINQFLTNMTGIDGPTLIRQIGFRTLNDVKSAIVSALYDRRLLIDRRGNLII